MTVSKTWLVRDVHNSDWEECSSRSEANARARSMADSLEYTGHVCIYELVGYADVEKKTMTKVTMRRVAAEPDAEEAT